MTWQRVNREESPIVGTNRNLWSKTALECYESGRDCKKCSASLYGFSFGGSAGWKCAMPYHVQKLLDAGIPTTQQGKEEGGRIEPGTIGSRSKLPFVMKAIATAHKEGRRLTTEDIRQEACLNLRAQAAGYFHELKCRGFINYPDKSPDQYTITPEGWAYAETLLMRVRSI